MQEKSTVVESLVEVMGCGMGWIRFVEVRLAGGISRVPSLALAMTLTACLSISDVLELSPFGLALLTTQASCSTWDKDM
jgi:hypothetical protein